MQSVTKKRVKLCPAGFRVAIFEYLYAKEEGKQMNRRERRDGDLMVWRFYELFHSERKL